MVALDIPISPGSGVHKPTLNPANALNLISSDLSDAEDRLISSLNECSIGDLNDIRQRLVVIRPSFVDRLDEWQKKLEVTTVEEEPRLPPYFDAQTHVIPGSSVIVREQEPSSIIAHTLSSVSRALLGPVTTNISSVAYFDELTNTSANDTVKSSEPGRWTVEVRRRQAPRDLLSLRTIAKKRSDSSIQKGNPGLPLSVAPNQPSIELSLEQVEGQSQASDRLGDLVKTINKATAGDPVLKARSSSMSESDGGGSRPPVRRYPGTLQRRTSYTSPQAPPSAFKSPRSVSSVASSRFPSVAVETPLSTASETWSSSVTSTITNSFSNLMSFGSNRNTGERSSLASLIGPLTLMSSMDTALSSTTLENEPHLHFTYTLPEKVKIECVVYYAGAFDSLRRRCAVDRSILESLSRCEQWEARGGKSKANFFMTSDKRYIVKELVSKWNMSDT